MAGPPITYKPKIIEDSFGKYLSNSDSTDVKTEIKDKHLKSILIHFDDILKETYHLVENVYQLLEPETTNIFVCLLKGGAIFFTYFINALDGMNKQNYPIIVDYWRIKTYEGQTKCSKSKISLDDNDLANLEGRNVFIVDEIIDSGSSMRTAIEWIKSKNPRSITTISLLMKRNPLNKSIYPDYCIYEIPNVWVVGFGCDMNGHYRQCRNIYVL